MSGMKMYRLVTALLAAVFIIAFFDAHAEETLLCRFILTKEVSYVDNYEREKVRKEPYLTVGVITTLRQLYDIERNITIVFKSGDKLIRVPGKSSHICEHLTQT
jgi:hypothetical protein